MCDIVEEGSRHKKKRGKGRGRGRGGLRQGTSGDEGFGWG